MLRIDSNILWTIINLLILYVLLRKFLFGRVHKIMDERAAQLEKIHADADADRREAEKLRKQNDDILRKADEELAVKEAASREKAGAEYDRIVSDANEKSAQIIEEARKKAQAAADIMKQQATVEIAGMVKDAAAKVAAADENQRLYDDFLSQVKDGQ